MTTETETGTTIDLAEAIAKAEAELKALKARAMLDYLDVLNARIRCFTNPNEE